MDCFEDQHARDDPTLATMVAFLYGDDAAAIMGFAPIGLDHLVGYRNATALARTARPDLADDYSS